MKLKDKKKMFYDFDSSMIISSYIINQFLPYIFKQFLRLTIKLSGFFNEMFGKFKIITNFIEYDEKIDKLRFLETE